VVVVVVVVVVVPRKPQLGPTRPADFRAKNLYVPHIAAACQIVTGITNIPITRMKMDEQ